jgi:glycerol-3-phosphate dehydrogenase
VINCAGLYGDFLDQKLIGKSEFEIRPRKGQFLVYDSAARQLLNSIILPVPNDITKGVVICQTAFGKVLVGPTAEEQQSRDDASVDTETLQMLRDKGEEMLPGLANIPVNATYAGIRPATEFKDYVIKHQQDKNYISVGGIRSTGLSAALGIAKKVFNTHCEQNQAYTPPDNIIWPDAPNQIAENETRDWHKDGNEGIICHCEWVTKREIQAALQGNMPAASLDGLKRRTRVTMGRCQGFYCSARLSELTEGHFAQPIARDIQDE